jgi:hypothetical protein
MLRPAALAVFLGAIAVLVAVSSARGDGTLYVVTTNADGPSSCGPYLNVPGVLACPTLRGAVAAADGNPGADVIVLQNTGAYPLTQGAITLTTDVTIHGQNAHLTTIQGNGQSRLFTVAPGVNAGLAGVTLSGGVAGLQEGGDVLNQGNLTLVWVRVTGGSATRGAGIANSGTLGVSYSLIDGNATVVDGGAQGGGISNTGQLVVQDSTIFDNTGYGAGAIYSPTGSLSLLHATVAGNHGRSTNPGGIIGPAGWSATGSLFAANVGDNLSNCGGQIPQPGPGNVEDFDSCITGPNSERNDIGLATALSDQGGHTDVLTIPASSFAKGKDTQCFDSVDQRFAPRNAGATCDAGAFEQGATAPPVTGFGIPGPVPGTTPTPTPTPSPTPVAGKTVIAKTVKGTVKVRLPGTNRFVELDGTQGIPVGATVDAKKGTVQLTSVQKEGGKLQIATFFDGIFKLGQTKTTTDLTLTEKLAACPKRGRASAAGKRPKTRRLWGEGKGSFRTRGTYSAATVRGTKWLVQDSCAGTLTRVTKGVVSVRDNVRRKTIIVRAGHRYLAKPRR